MRYDESFGDSSNPALKEYLVALNALPLENRTVPVVVGIVLQICVTESIESSLYPIALSRLS